MDSTLALFDFTGIPPHRHNYAPCQTQDTDRMLERMEQASAVGDLPALANELLGLRASSHADDTINIGNSLYLAVQNAHYKSVECILQHGFPVTTNAVGAATRAKDTKMLDVLLNNGWDIDMPLGLTTPSALALAVEDFHLTSWLLDHGANPNAKCSLDLTPLSCAVQFASFSTIQTLFEHGGSVQYGQLLHYAIRRRLPDRLDVLALILSKKPPINNVMYQEDATSYIQQRAFALGTPLHEAAEQGQLDSVRMLLENGSHPLIKDSRGEIPCNGLSERIVHL